MATCIKKNGVKLDSTLIPAHVAIIMDGNGRWAVERGWMRSRGHQQGADVVRMVTTESVALGIQHLTLYCFSSENWQRSSEEIDCLMMLLNAYLTDELATLQENNVRLHAIGQLERLPVAVRETLTQVMDATAGNTAMTLHLALSYGGRDEIVDACRGIVRAIADGSMQAADINTDTFSEQLYTVGIPDVDVLIRTANEQRISNFLPWQTAYAEFVSVRPYWPDFTAKAYMKALAEYQKRNRRFGGVTTLSSSEN